MHPARNRAVTHARRQANSQSPSIAPRLGLPAASAGATAVLLNPCSACRARQALFYDANHGRLSIIAIVSLMKAKAPKYSLELIRMSFVCKRSTLIFKNNRIANPAEQTVGQSITLGHK